MSSTTKKRWGDRKDARWIRDMDSLHVILPHLMNHRTDAEVYVNMEFDVTEALRYIARKNEGEEEYRATLFHCILMAVAKTIYLRPQLNSFISGRRFYQRDEITLGFVAKKRFEDHSEESLVVISAPEDWTLTEVTHRQGSQGPHGKERRCEWRDGRAQKAAASGSGICHLDHQDTGLLWQGARLPAAG